MSKSRTQLPLWPGLIGDVTWSVSRDRRLRDCKRRYYFQHYASRAGGSAGADARRRELFVLKHLKNRHMWLGEIVHELVELLLGAWRRGEDIPVDALVERGTRKMRAQYAESMQGIYRERPGRACGLIEHEYQHAVSADVWRGVRDKMEACLRGFFDLGLEQELRDVPPVRWLSLESLSSFVIEGATILVKPDLALRSVDGGVVLYDWKTGKVSEEDGRKQLAVYGLYARHVWGAQDDRLVGKLAFLGAHEILAFSLRPDDLAQAQAAIERSVEQMRLLAEPTDLSDEERFPMTDDRSRCERCNFRRICSR